MKIVVFESEERETMAINRIKPPHDVQFVAEPLGANNVGSYADAEIVSTFIYSKLGRDVLERMPALKLVATRSTGYDHIDIDFCRERGIVVCNVPTYGENTVAEHAFALLLAISHHIPEAIERARTGPYSPAGLQGFDLAGKTLGVVGTGNIGRHVIRIAKGFAMDVIAFDVKPDTQLAASVGFRYLSLEKLLETADVISLHLPGCAQNVVQAALSRDAPTSSPKTGQFT